MSTVEKIEAEIARLSPKEVAQLTRWLVGYDATLWDKQLKEDSKKGDWIACGRKQSGDW